MALYTFASSVFYYFGGTQNRKKAMYRNIMLFRFAPYLAHPEALKLKPAGNNIRKTRYVITASWNIPL